MCGPGIEEPTKKRRWEVQLKIPAWLDCLYTNYALKAHSVFVETSYDMQFAILFLINH